MTDPIDELPHYGCEANVHCAACKNNLLTSTPAISLYVFCEQLMMLDLIDHSLVAHLPPLTAVSLVVIPGTTAVSRNNTVYRHAAGIGLEKDEYYYYCNPLVGTQSGKLTTQTDEYIQQNDHYGMGG